MPPVITDSGEGDSCGDMHLCAQERKEGAKQWQRHRGQKEVIEEVR